MKIHSLSFSKYELRLDYVYNEQRNPVLSGARLNQDYMPQ
jgi:hypothetical protein